MPPRWLTLGIIVLWIGMTSWLFVREYWPQLQPGQPPPIRIDLADEAQNNIPVRWTIFRENEDRGYARTWVNFRDQDDDVKRRTHTAGEWEFELGGEFKLWKTSDRYGQPDFLVRNKYRVTREGELREFQSVVSINIKIKIPKPRDDKDSSQEDEVSHQIEVLALSGEVRDNFCYPHIAVSPEVKEWAPIAAVFERQMEPVAMPKRATLLNPLEPVNKLAKVRKGQHWRIPLIDPLTALWQKSPRVNYLNARVLPETQWHKWGANKAPVPCLVIEYEGDDISGYTWVQEEDGLVVGQEITQHGDKLRLWRD
jgi:hypothetical protein